MARRSGLCVRASSRSSQRTCPRYHESLDDLHCPRYIGSVGVWCLSWTGCSIPCTSSNRPSRAKPRENVAARSIRANASECIGSVAEWSSSRLLIGMTWVRIPPGPSRCFRMVFARACPSGPSVRMLGLRPRVEGSTPSSGIRFASTRPLRGLRMLRMRRGLVVLSDRLPPRVSASPRPLRGLVCPVRPRVGSLILDQQMGVRLPHGMLFIQWLAICG